ncbi:hypothetical protein M885DRAFT_532756 [Pelagophyceae sp. CCMP2097]|nr:hypothetical protein M885DRAFT_532756 [Pelagophyceae sp. CCMP2097]|mmetsp:Transcript_22804/g.78091  ORF Transcript_22804/g.78091 Transcript_22804/m.78091 type:complete len:220 (-) Transcript_22804:75-734(-)
MLATLITLAGCASALVAPTRTLRSATAVSGAPVAVMPEVVEGLHGSASCFLPLDQMQNTDRWPRLVRVAGAYPGLTAAELAAVPSPVPPAANGMWTFDFPDEQSATFGVVAMKGTDLLDALADPVVVVASSSSLGLSLPEDTEVLVCIDRGDTLYDDRQFFAYADSAGDVTIRRMEDGDGDEPPVGWTIQGRVGFVKLPFDIRRVANRGTWLEEDEDIF